MKERGVHDQLHIIVMLMARMGVHDGCHPGGSLYNGLMMWVVLDPPAVSPVRRQPSVTPFSGKLLSPVAFFPPGKLGFSDRHHANRNCQFVVRRAQEGSPDHRYV